jgi:hypothetical protein
MGLLPRVWASIVYFRRIYLYPLTIVGGVRERLVDTRRGRWKTVCARGSDLALLGGPSTSPLEGAINAAARFDAWQRVLPSDLFGS